MKLVCALVLAGLLAEALSMPDAVIFAGYGKGAQDHGTGEPSK